LREGRSHQTEKVAEMECLFFEAHSISQRPLSVGFVLEHDLIVVIT
jgi:hypothetical protein